ncbi:MAG: hypothetical protein J5556_04845, partial [Deltaproteobacteria bacterium]|nr:hypothetical protein [Deltaproteobacteria bacterium]
LRLAVSYSNEFDFANAEKCLEKWDVTHGGKPMGSALWDGKILSSRGQYAAFLNKPEKALEFFDQALTCFEMLRGFDERAAQKQIEQTSVYAAIAAMDCENVSREELTRRMEAALGSSVLDAIFLFKGTEERFLQHLLVRYLVQRGTEEERRAYFSTYRTWLGSGMGKGHPWPIIQYLRAQLTDDKKLKHKLAESIGWAASRNSDTTVDFIMTTLLIASGALDPDSEDGHGMIRTLRKKLPLMRCACDLMEKASPGDASLVNEILTFNYR